MFVIETFFNYHKATVDIRVFSINIILLLNILYIVVGGTTPINPSSNDRQGLNVDIVLSQQQSNTGWLIKLIFFERFDSVLPIYNFDEKAANLK